jgi:parallel beta-helix repeat protein
MSPAPVAMTFTVTNTDDAGPGSLRQALLDANTNVGQSDTILFAIPGTGPHTISLSSEPLPTITDPVLVDAPDTGDCSGGAPTVRLDGALLEGGAGLAVSTTGATIRGLAITRFLGPGILLSGGGSNVIECSYLGLAPDGVTVAGNTVGIRVINSSNNTVGGTSTAVRNVISGNTRGVEVLGQVGPASGNLIQGNFIGTDASGALDRGNAQNGVHVIDAANNTVGGAPAARNVVSGNGGEGVRIDGALATGNLVQGNYIGTNAAGTGDVGNSASGVYIRRAPGNSVVLNVVSGNDGFAGVAVCGRLSFCGGGDLGTQGSNASGNGIHSNLIGTTADQSSPLGNNGHGVSIDGAVNTVVGGNLITASGAQGVVIFGAGATANQVAANNVHSNAGLGIDLGDADAADGVTPNDPGDGDAGPNGLQNFPVLTSATSAPGVTTVEGSLNSAPNTAFTIDFFFSGACDPSGNGEGFQFMGSHSQSTNADGNLSFRAIFNASLSAPGTVVTAVATSPVDGSSEFSACVTVAPPGAFTFTVTNTDDNGPGSLRQALLDANGNENPAFTDTILFAIPGDPPHTIALLSPLPGIGEPVLIDAPPTGDCNGTPPTVEIDGNAAGPATHGLFVDTGGVIIRGLALTRFSLSGIFFGAAGSNVVECSYLGLAPDGVTAKGNIDGVLISGSSNNTVGGTTAAVRNVISGNRAAGVRIAGSNLTNGNQVLGNYIGTNADGTAAVGNGTSGVQVEQPSNTVRGNLISGNQAGVTIENGATNVVVAANLIGTNGAGTAAIPNTTVGVLVSGRPDNHIGGAGAGEGNLLSGNASHGVWLLGSTASNNTIRGNRIGTNAAGDAVLANGGRGVLVTGGSANTIGGSAAGAGNLISGNDGGVELIGTAGTIVQGNRIGTDALGAVALGNGPVGSGVSLDGAQTATIGGTSAGARNLISGNFRGVQCTNGSSGNVFQGNYVGTTADGSTALGNSSAGMVLSSCPSNTIGGTAAGAGNVISGNTSFGVWIATAGDNVLQGNLIGTNAAGTAAVPNTSTGLVLTPGATTTIIGGTEPGAGNVISGNGESGLEFNGASGNSAQGNVIGLASSGSATLPNAGEGIRIANGATGNTIGGTTAAARNIISGNLLNGVQITGFGDSGTSANLVQGNYIGTDRDGTAALGNGLSGIRVSRATNNIIGSGPDGPAGNLISGNTDGVWIDGPTSSGNQVQGNLIGTDASGTAAVGNTAAGVRVDGGAQSTSIGGNIVSGNGGDGIVVGPTTGTSVSGNLIGTTNFATAALGNGGHGVLLSVGAAATIGGDSIENFRNIISANGGNGIRILANGILVRGNRIGADPSGSPGFGNRLAGVAIEQGAANNTIGGTDTGAARNFIAFNGEAGIRAGDAGPGNSFRFNNIDANGGLGIDLGALGVTPNDASDGDRGPNDLQNFPVLTSATSVSGTTTIQGTLNSTANTDFVIDFFDNPACDPSLNGEGLIWFGSHTQSSDASGNLSFTAGFAGGPAEGTFVTAIATSADGSTSEFSACVLVPTP